MKRRPPLSLDWRLDLGRKIAWLLGPSRWPQIREHTGLFQGAYQFATSMDDEQERAAVLDAINTFRAQGLAEAGGRLEASEHGSGSHEMFEKAASAADEIRSAGQKVVALVLISTGQASRPVTTPQRPLLTAALSDQVSDLAR